jgi:Type I restriction enzyme R protein N terminus (HSDR_N)
MPDPIPFATLNETDVREEIIAPLLRKLGYRSGTRNNIIREQSLRYGRLSLGRKDPKKDPELRGKADYILEVDKRLRWVIEAKAPDAVLNNDEVEQAWTYANHPEVRAIYFALCNGRTFVVYRTVHSPEARPILSVVYERFDQDFHLVDGILGRDALLRDFPSTELDVGLPIAPGLRSIARITGGVVRYEKNSLNSPVLSELQAVVEEGAVERNETGGLIAFLRARVPIRSLQEVNERLGLSTFEMSTIDNQLSLDSSTPTVLIYENTITLPEGEKLLDMSKWQQIALPMNIQCHVRAEARGSFQNGLFSGSFETKIESSLISVGMSGLFEVHLA